MRGNAAARRPGRPIGHVNLSIVTLRHGLSLWRRRGPPATLLWSAKVASAAMHRFLGPVYRGPVYQIGEPIPNRTSDEQGGKRLFRRISAHISSCAGALLIRGGGGLGHLVSDLASGTLDRIARLRYRLNSGTR